MGLRRKSLMVAIIGALAAGAVVAGTTIAMASKAT